MKTNKLNKVIPGVVGEKRFLFTEKINNGEDVDVKFGFMEAGYNQAKDEIANREVCINKERLIRALVESAVIPLFMGDNDLETSVEMDVELAIKIIDVVADKLLEGKILKIVEDNNEKR